MIVKKAILLLKGGQHFCTEKNAILLLLENFLLVKGGLHFCTEKKCHPPFISKIQISNKRSAMFQKMHTTFYNLSLTTAIMYMITMGFICIGKYFHKKEKKHWVSVMGVLSLPYLVIDKFEVLSISTEVLG